MSVGNNLTEKFGALVIAVSSLIAGSVSASAMPNVTIGYENNGADPFMVTKALGLFKKMIPAHIQLRYFSSGPAAMGALASNSLQFMCGIGMPPYVEALAKKLPVTIIYNQERYMTGAGIVVRPRAGIHDIRDLKGKKIAIVVGSQSSFELATFLKQAGIPFSSVRQLNMSPKDMLIAWRTGGVNAAIVWNPVFHALQSLGGKVLKTDENLPRTATSYNLCIANIHWAKKHPRIAADFVRSMNAGVTYTRKHPQQALALMAKESGATLADAKVELAGYEVFTGKDQLSSNVLGTGAGSATSATTMAAIANAKVLQRIGLIDAPISSEASTIVDSKFAQLALK